MKITVMVMVGTILLAGCSTGTASTPASPTTLEVTCEQVKSEFDRFMDAANAAVKAGATTMPKQEFLDLHDSVVANLTAMGEAGTGDVNKAAGYASKALVLSQDSTAQAAGQDAMIAATLTFKNACGYPLVN